MNHLVYSQYIGCVLRMPGCDVQPCTMVRGMVCGPALHHGPRYGLWSSPAPCSAVWSVVQPCTPLHGTICGPRYGLWSSPAPWSTVRSVVQPCTVVHGTVCGPALHRGPRYGLWSSPALWSMTLLTSLTFSTSCTYLTFLISPITKLP